MPAPAGQLHLELVDNEEVVVCRVREINKPHRLLPTLLPVGQKRELTFYTRHGDWFGWGQVLLRGR